MFTQFISYPVVIAMSYYIASFVQAYLHRQLAHRPVGGLLFRTHTGSHHTIYSGDRLVAGAYGIDEKSLSAVYALPALLVALAAYMLLPLGLFITAAAALSLTFAAHVHVHARYHLQDAWLARFAWFRKKRELHFIHHRNQAANFAVLEFMWDRLMGSYIPLPRVK